MEMKERDENMDKKEDFIKNIGDIRINILSSTNLDGVLIIVNQDLLDNYFEIKYGSFKKMGEGIDKYFKEKEKLKKMEENNEGENI